jgi:hypothetical protein
MRAPAREEQQVIGGHEMVTQTKQTKVTNEAVESEVRAVAQTRDTRLRLVAATLLSGLSVAVPAVLLVFVYPLAYAEYHRYDRSVALRDAMWEPAVWWTFALGGIAISMACAVAGAVLATRRPAATAPDAQSQDGNISHPVARWAALAMGFAILALVFAPLLRSTSVSAGGVLVGLGIVGIGVAAAFGASDPAFTRRWLNQAAVICFVLALLGNIMVLLWFMLIGFTM